MKQRLIRDLPAEHLDPVPTFAVPPQLPARLAGNRVSNHAPDPYYDVFRDRSEASVVSYDETHEVAERNGRRMPRVYAALSGRSTPELLATPERNAIIRLLAGLASYRALTSTQAAALCECPGLADPQSGLVADLFRVGLIRLSPAFQGETLGSAGRGVAVYQLGARKQVTTLLALLTHAEALAITGGYKLSTQRAHTRHDVLAAEVALRLSSIPHVGTVLGPHFSTFERLGIHVARSEQIGGPDLVVVRDDGLRIAIEIAATAGNSFHTKAERWAKILEENPFETSGLTVVFLSAPSLESLHQRGTWPRRDLYLTVDDARTKHPGGVRDLTAARMGIATWREWFPEARLANDRFRLMRVDRPTGRTPLWEPVDLLDPDTLRVTGPSSRNLRAVIVAAALLAQTPPRLRDKHRPADLNTDLLRRDTIPLPVPVAAHGAASTAHLPRRLLGPGPSTLAEHQRVDAPARSPHDWHLPGDIAHVPLPAQQQPSTPPLKEPTPDDRSGRTAPSTARRPDPSTGVPRRVVRRRPRPDGRHS